MDQISPIAQYSMPTPILVKWAIMSYTEPMAQQPFGLCLWIEVYKAFHISSHFQCEITVKGLKEKIKLDFPTRELKLKTSRLR